MNTTTTIVNDNLFFFSKFIHVILENLLLPSSLSLPRIYFNDTFTFFDIIFTHIFTYIQSVLYPKHMTIDIHTYFHTLFHTKGELPLFEDFSASVREETAMLNYIEKNYPEPPLIPSPEKDRAFYGKILSWFHEANGAFAQTCKDMINTFIELEEKSITSHKKLPKEMKDYKTLVQYWKQKIESEMLIWENRLGNDMNYFNDSDRPSIVDVSLFPYYYQIVRYGLNEQNLPKLKKWRERMEERESVKRTLPTGWQVHPFLLKF